MALKDALERIELAWRALRGKEIHCSACEGWDEDPGPPPTPEQIAAWANSPLSHMLEETMLLGSRARPLPTGKVNLEWVPDERWWDARWDTMGGISSFVRASDGGNLQESERGVPVDSDSPVDNQPAATMENVQRGSDADNSSSLV